MANACWISSYLIKLTKKHTLMGKYSPVRSSKVFVKHIEVCLSFLLYLFFCSFYVTFLRVYTFHLVQALGYDLQMLFDLTSISNRLVEVHLGKWIKFRRKASEVVIIVCVGFEWFPNALPFSIIIISKWLFQLLSIFIF